MGNPTDPKKFLLKKNDISRLRDERGYFDEIAPRWDDMRRTYFSERVRDRALSEARVQQGKLAADVGVGTGFITEGLIAYGVGVLAIDESLPMLQVLRRKAFSAVGLHCCIGTAERLPVRTGAVDYVFANMCLHHVVHPAAAIGEMARILKKGGMLIITDLDEHTFAFLTEERTDRWMGFGKGDVRTWFTETGLKDVTVRDTGERANVPSDSSDNRANIGIFMARGTK
ncbi:MAG: class I SAM-dependent methyltransferase [Halobacteriota archaeon]